MLITSEVQNNTTRHMQAMEGKLVQTISYHASGKKNSRTTKNVEKAICYLPGMYCSFIYFFSLIHAQNNN